MLRRRSADLAVSNQQLKQEVLRRKGVEEALRKSENHYGLLLKQSLQMQEQLRHLTRQLLLAQEEERKWISRELHDEIAQTLTGINAQLAALKAAAAHNTKGLQSKISHAQRMVEKSVDIVHRFARELRPTVLDDLGLIPALHSFVKGFSKQTRVHVRLTVFAGVEKLDNARRTVLYRVAQEALTNVARHAQARRVEVSIEKRPDSICLKVKDDGKSFEVDRVLHAKRKQTIGIARHARAGRDGRWQLYRRVGAWQRHHHPRAHSSHERQKELVFMKRITVLLAEDHEIVREGFRKLLEAEDDIEVIGEARDRPPGGGIDQTLRPRRGRDGHCDAAAQWVGSHTADPQIRSQHQDSDSLRA